jgi:uncharacterized protein (DUF1697 family)
MAKNMEKTTRFVAFLRAINVGGHVVSMARLRAQFEALGFEDVETFIASGNVVFSSPSKNAAALEKRIEDRLAAALGYEVKTFLRTEAEVAEVAACKPFTAARRKAAGALCVGFLAQPLDPTGVKALMALRTDDDDFHVNGREIYWICRTGQGVSKFSNALFERMVKARTTFRGMNTMTRLAAKLTDASGAGK